jgi:flavin-dependent dehydrogenase
MIVKHICIVGGGSAGWMTAFALMRSKPEIKVTLIESPDIETIGVGESLLQHFQEYVQLTGLDDREWMPACDATFKTSISFTDWTRNKGTFQYPFGDWNFPKYENKLNTIADLYLLQEFYPELHPKDFVLYLNQVNWLAEYNRLSDNASFRDRPRGENNQRHEWSYHMDAVKFANYLASRCEGKVERILATVDYVDIDENGVNYIQYGDKKIEADLFVDCTGFKALLIGDEKLESEWEDFSLLRNDSAVAARIPYKTEEEQQAVRNTTDCKTMTNGWMWDIPLWSRTGKGYVYSSKYIDKDDAEKEFREETGWEGDVRHIKFKHGCHKRFINKNVVAIGLSYGFLEPLESTGLLTTHENIIQLLNALNINGNDNYWDNLTCEFVNPETYIMITGLAEFVYMHYFLATRGDTEYWLDIGKDFKKPGNNSFFNPVFAMLTVVELFSEADAAFTNTSKSQLESPNKSSGMLALILGMNRKHPELLKVLKSLRASYGTASFFGPDNKKYIDWLITDGYAGFRNFLQYREMQIMREPTTYQYLKNNIYNENL